MWTPDHHTHTHEGALPKLLPHIQYESTQLSSMSLYAQGEVQKDMVIQSWCGGREP